MRTSKCKADSFRTDISELCDNCPLRKDIPEWIEKQIVAQVKRKKELLKPERFEIWLSSEIKSSVDALDKMRQESMRAGTHWGGISEISSVRL